MTDCVRFIKLKICSVKLTRKADSRDRRTTVYTVCTVQSSSSTRNSFRINFIIHCSTRDSFAAHHRTFIGTIVAVAHYIHYERRPVWRTCWTCMNPKHNTIIIIISSTCHTGGPRITRRKYDIVRLHGSRAGAKTRRVRSVCRRTPACEVYRSHARWKTIFAPASFRDRVIFVAHLGHHHHLLS